MGQAVQSRAIWRGLTTVNAPLAVHVDAGTLLACLHLETTDRRWQPHVRAFFSEVGQEVLMDMVIEGSVSFDDLYRAIRFWNADKDSGNARWIGEMAPVSMADSDGAHPESGGLRRN